MSGICAVWGRGKPIRTAELLAAMNAGLSLNRSEQAMQRCVQGVGVGVSARFSEQQVYSDGNILLACDADLLNDKELLETINHGTSASENTGTATLLAALYEKHGCAFVEKLRGAFSVLLWDEHERRVLAAIDGFGIKRLVYYQQEDLFLVASRIDALVQSGRIDLTINPKSIANVLNFTSNVGPETIFTRVQRLSPGMMLVASEQSQRIEKYWDMRYDACTDSRASRLSRELESVIECSVASQCKTDPLDQLGAFLSGGTDSSTVVGLMTRHAQGPVKAFSIGFEDQHFNELEYAELAARRFGSEHHTYMVTPADCLDALPQMVRYFDEPYGNSSAIPTYFCSRLAAQHGVKVMLAGDGGDELFGGNERYATDKLFEVYHQLPGFLRRGVIEPLVRAAPVQGGLLRRARGYIRRANMPGVERMLSFQFLRTHPLADIFEGEFLQELGDYTILDVPAYHYSQASASDHLDRLLYVDVKITLADNDLPKVTCMSELAGIQVRFPYLDRSVAEFSGRIPAHLKVKAFDKRYLFKRAFHKLLPIEIIKKKKHGFGIPVARWINCDKRLRELSRDTLLSARASRRGYFRQSFIEDLFRKSETDNSTYYGDTIWTFLALELWHRQVVDEPTKVGA
jgi:asparagine synthase (glutamine-hydrolysing)